MACRIQIFRDSVSPLESTQSFGSKKGKERKGKCPADSDGDWRPEAETLLLSGTSLGGELVHEVIKVDRSTRVPRVLVFTKALGERPLMTGIYARP